VDESEIRDRTDQISTGTPVARVVQVREKKEQIRPVKDPD
jgi:hypothetical protein